MKIFRSVLSASLIAVLSLPAPLSTAWSKDPTDPDADYDRLDYMGESGKKVDVIEWEGNLEIHVYPAGSLRGLGLKMDRKNGKKVMVISYRFDTTPKPLIRRALVSIDLTENFKVFKDPTEREFDKIVISNNGLAKPLVAFKTDPEPTQLYPDGHPALANGQEKPEKKAPARATASQSDSAPPARTQTAPTDENGTIKPFSF